MSTCAPPADGPALAAPLCPLCGQPNQCAAAATGSLDTACWCREVTISPTTLTRIPEAQKSKACLCRACATGEHSPKQ